MSRIGKHFNSSNSGDFNSSDFKPYGDGISAEYIIAINDLGFGSIINDSRTRALTKKTNCTIEVTPRILNKRVNLYRWIKYAIIKISGPDEASLNQCLRLLERHFPVFHQLKEYTRRANVTIFTNDLNMPDNIPCCNPIMRSASTMSSCQGLLVKSPFETNGRRVLNQLPWKISKPEITGCYFQTHMVENPSQPSLPYNVCSRNIDSNSKLNSGSLELDAKKIRKNKLFGSMGTLSDSNNPDDLKNMYGTQTGESLNKDVKGSQTFRGNIAREKETLLKSHVDDKSLAQEYYNKNQMIANMNRKIDGHPLNPNIYYGHFTDDKRGGKPEQNTFRQAMEACADGGIKISTQYIKSDTDIFEKPAPPDCTPLVEKHSELQSCLPRKSAEAARANITAKKPVLMNKGMKNQRNLQKNVVPNQASENVSRKLQQYQVLGTAQAFPKTTNLEAVRNQECNQIPVNASSLHSLDSLPNSPTHSRTVSQGEVISLSHRDNQGLEITPEFNELEPKSSKLRLSFTSTSGMCNFVTNIIMINIPASEIVNSSQVLDNKLTANNIMPLVSASSNVVSDKAKCEPKEISQIEHKTSSVRGVDEWVCLSKDTTFPVYTSSQSMVAVEPEQTSCINSDPINFQQIRESRNPRNSPKLLEIKTSIVSDGVARDTQIQVKEMKFESVRSSTIGNNQVPQLESNSQINVQPVSGVSKNISPALSFKESPSGLYVNGINRASPQRSQNSRNPVINIIQKKEILNSISERLKNPKDGTLIIMFEGNDIFCTGQMSMAYKPADSADQNGGDNLQVFFESTEYFVTAESRGTGGPKIEKIKTFHAPQFDQCNKPK